MAQLEPLAQFILSWEGGFVNDPSDAGGATNSGVTLATWQRVGYDKDFDGDIDVQDLRLLNRNDAIERVLRPHYWNTWKADLINNQYIANLLVDWVWASGKWGIVIPQRMLNVDIDGVVGMQTINALNKQNPQLFFSLLHQRRAKYIEDICISHPTWRKFKSGWLRRLNSIGYGYLKNNV